VVWFYFDNVFHAKVTNDEWLAQKVLFVQPKYISFFFFLTCLYESRRGRFELVTSTS
jgi:hypothetical protein